jgi:tetratricopeptide (TPR) repeat protein
VSKVNLFGDAKVTARAADSGRKLAALQEAQQLFRDKPSKETQYALATSFFDVGRFEEAERLLADLIQTYGDDRQILYDLAFTYKNLGRIDEAKTAFAKIIALDPKHNLARSAEQELWRIDPTSPPSWVKK